MAEMLIVGYRLDLATADDLLAVARPWPGRSSPMRTGRFPDESMRDETLTRWPAAQ
jgi:hypothetical protein